jgi:hypothetical protein
LHSMLRRTIYRRNNAPVVGVLLVAALVGLLGSHPLPVHLSGWSARSAKAIPVPAPTTGQRLTPRPGMRGEADAPVLVLTDPGTVYGDALCSAILATEGLPTCAATDAGNLTPALTLTPFQVIILAAGPPLSSAQVAQVTAWVRQGGDLIAMRPADNLDRLLGLGSSIATLADGYLRIDTRRPPGAGLEAETMRYHGDADEHPLRGASAVARLYSSTSDPAGYPAMTLHRVGAGTASAYSFDLARSVLRTRNGDPDLIGKQTVSSDDQIRLADRFGHNYLDLSRASIPQADELMHLLTHQILQATPLPRLWYLPTYRPQTHIGGLLRAAVVLTGDDHDFNSQTLARFAAERAASPPGCSPAEWTCVTSTSYAYPGAFSDAAAKPYTDQGFEVGPHFSDQGMCTTLTSQTQLDRLVAADMKQWQSAYPSISAAHPPITERWHCYGDWTTDVGVPQASADVGINADLSTACWPESVFDVSQCLLTGTQLPMPYADRNGRLTAVNEFTTVITDENADVSSGQAMAELIRNAVGSKQFYGYLTALAHLDDNPASNRMAQELVAQAKSADIPVISASQAAQFWAGRSATRISAVRYGKADMSFTVANPVHNLELMVPIQDGARRLTSIERDGVELEFSTQRLDGVQYALLPAAAAGRYVAGYGIG